MIGASWLIVTKPRGVNQLLTRQSADLRGRLTDLRSAKLNRLAVS